MTRTRARKRAPQSASTQPDAGAEARQNRLLAALPVAERRRLLQHCKPVQLQFGELLYEQDERIRYAYFPTGGFVSMISSVDDRTRLEVGLIGTEGMLGVSLLAGVATAPLRALVQGAGPALRIEASRFPPVLGRSPVLHGLLLRYIVVLMGNLAQMAACTRFHLVEARLARWLLMTRDRARSDRFQLTQEFLAYMLGVRRVGVTVAAQALRERKLIRYSRGEMTLLDSAGLEAAACGCYAAGEAAYERIMAV